MERLIVKNFGPIKEADIELNKYVVLIGDTSTGKSVLAKLIAIFRDSCNILNFKHEVDKIDIRKELKRYNIDFDTQHCEIEYYDGVDSSLQLENSNIISLSNKEEGFLLNSFQPQDSVLKTIKNFLPYLSMDEINKTITDLFLKRVHSTYIPAERILFSLVGNSLSGLWANNVALPECYKDFAAKYEVARKDINSFEYKNLGIEYDYNNGIDTIVLNNTKVLLTEASSGIQSLMPLLLVLDYDVKNDEDDYRNSFTVDYTPSFIIEEPELNLFPVKQKKIIDHLVKKVSNKKHKIVITTHSPYILSSLDTLILAKNTFNERLDLKDEINKIVSEDKWIDYNEIAVYEIRNDGKVYSIKNEEFKSIDANAIDNVSNTISEEFDKLTELRYAQ